MTDTKCPLCEMGYEATPDKRIDEKALMRLIGKALVEEMAKDILSVQPMPDDLMKRVFDAAMSEQDLIANGYEPVSDHKLLWIKKDQPTSQYNILNPEAKIKDVCHKCKYLNPAAEDFYRCRVSGYCPAAQPRDA